MMKRLLSLICLLLFIPTALAETDAVRLEYEGFQIDVPGNWYVYQEPDGEDLEDAPFLYLWPTIEGDHPCNLNVCRTPGTADNFSGYNEYSARNVAKATAEALDGTDASLIAFEKGARDGRDIMCYIYSMRIGDATVYFSQLLAAMGDQGIYTFTVTFYESSELPQFEPVLDTIHFK